MEEKAFNCRLCGSAWIYSLGEDWNLNAKNIIKIWEKTTREISSHKFDLVIKEHSSLSIWTRIFKEMYHINTNNYEFIPCCTEGEAPLST